MKKELKERMIELQNDVVKKLGDDSDLLVTVFNNGQCGCAMHGETQNIAHSLFALIHDNDSKLAPDLYRVIKLIVLNIVNNESPYAADLLQSILNTPGTEIQAELPENDKAAVIIQMPVENEQ